MNKEQNKWVLKTASILRSIERVFRTQEIDNLTTDAYKFVMNLSGFIAHYDVNGFRSYYHNVADLLSDLDCSLDVMQAERYIKDSFFAESVQSEYYASKYECLVAIKELIPLYRDKILETGEMTHEERYTLVKDRIERLKRDNITTA